MRDLDEPDDYEGALFGCYGLFVVGFTAVALVIGSLIWWVTS